MWLLATGQRRESDKLSQALPWEVLGKLRERIKTIFAAGVLNMLLTCKEVQEGWCV